MVEAQASRELKPAVVVVGLNMAKVGFLAFAYSQQDFSKEKKKFDYYYSVGPFSFLVCLLLWSFRFLFSTQSTMSCKEKSILTESHLKRELSH